MKKIFSCIVALFAAVSLYAADLNIYASGLKATQAEGVTTVEYVLNAPATAVTVYLYPAEGEAVVLSLTDSALLAKGAHQAVLDLSGVAGGTYTWAIKAEAAAHDTDIEVGAQNVQATYARGLAIDLNPESPRFGTIYTADALGTSVAGGRILMVSPDLATVDTILSTNCWPVASGSAPYHINLGEDGMIYAADWSDNAPNITRFDPANPAAGGTKVFGADSVATSGLAFALVGEEYVPIHGSMTGCYMEGTGADRVLYTVDEDMKTNGKLCVYAYNVGNMETPWKAAPSAVKFTNAQSAFLNSNSNLFTDGHGGFWMAQHRANYDATPSFWHVAATDTVDFKIGDQMGTTGLNTQGSLFVTPDKELVVTTNAHIACIWKPYFTGNVLDSCVVIQRVTTDVAGNRCVAMDPARNIYVFGSTCMWVYAAATADNSYTTPAPAASTIVVEAGEAPSDGAVYAYTNGGAVEEQNVQIACQGGKILFGAATSKWEKKPISGFDTDSIMAYKLDGDAKTDGTNSKYVRCLLNSPLHAGDKIVISGYSGSKPGANIGFFATIDRAASDTIGYVSHTAAQNTFGSDTLVVPAEYEGLYDFFITRGNGKSIYFYGVQVLSDVAPLAGRRIGANEVIYLHAAHVNWWQNDNAVQTAWFISAAGDTTTITGVEHANAEYVGFTMPATGTFATVKFGRGNESTIWNTTGDIALEGTTENCVMEFANNSAEAVWGHFDDSAPVQVTYKIKHPWGGGSWTWKDLTEDTDGTWYIADIYGGAGCNVDPKVLGKDWISSPTLVNEPASGDSCLFVVNPLATTEAEIITITKLGSTDTVPVPPTPVDTLRLYEIGNNQGWDPTAAIEMTATADSIFEGDFAFTADTTWFAFITVKPETADWNLVNANRYGGANNNELVLNGTYNLAKGEYGFKANSGEYHIVVNIPAMTMTIQKKTSEGLNDMKADDQVMKIYENGQIYIIRNGVRYTAAGAKVE